MEIPTLEKMPFAIAELGSKVDELFEFVKHKKEEKDPEGERPINIRDASKHVHRAVATLYIDCKKGEIPHHKRKGKLYFFKSELTEWLKEGAVKVAS